MTDQTPVILTVHPPTEVLQPELMRWMDEQLEKAMCSKYTITLEWRAGVVPAGFEGLLLVQLTNGAIATATADDARSGSFKVLRWCNITPMITMPTASDAFTAKQLMPIDETRDWNAGIKTGSFKPDSFKPDPELAG